MKSSLAQNRTHSAYLIREFCLLDILSCKLQRTKNKANSKSLYCYKTNNSPVQQNATNLRNRSGFLYREYSRSSSRIKSWHPHPKIRKVNWSRSWSNSVSFASMPGNISPVFPSLDSFVIHRRTLFVRVLISRRYTFPNRERARVLYVSNTVEKK